MHVYGSRGSNSEFVIFRRDDIENRMATDLKKSKTIVDELREQLESSTIKPSQKFINSSEWNDLKREQTRVI